MQTQEIYMTIDGSKCAEYPLVLYHQTATDAALACGYFLWNCTLPALSIGRLMPGDEMTMSVDYSVIRLTGKDIDYVDLRN